MALPRFSIAQLSLVLVLIMTAKGEGILKASVNPLNLPVENICDSFYLYFGLRKFLRLCNTGQRMSLRKSTNCHAVLHACNIVQDANIWNLYIYKIYLKFIRFWCAVAFFPGKRGRGHPRKHVLIIILKLGHSFWICDVTLQKYCILLTMHACVQATFATKAQTMWSYPIKARLVSPLLNIRRLGMS